MSFGPRFGYAQIDSTIVISEFTSFKNVTVKTGLFFTKDQNFNIQDLAKVPFIKSNNHFSNFKDRDDFLRSEIYTRLKIFNDDTVSAKIYLYFGPQFRKIDLYTDRNGQIETFVFENAFDGYVPLELRTRESFKVFAKLTFARTTRSMLEPTIIKAEYLQQHRSQVLGKNEDLKITSYITCGMILMIVIFSFANFTVRVKPDYLLYTLYAFSVFLLILGSTFFFDRSGIFAVNFFEYYDFVLFMIGLIFYCGFKLYFFNLFDNYPRLYKFVQLELFFVVFCFMLSIFLWIFDCKYTWMFRLENIVKAILLLLGIGFVILSFLESDRFLSIFNFGYVLALILWMVSFALTLSTKRASAFNTPIFYYQLGYVASLLGYLFSLNYRTREKLIAKLKEEQEMKMYAERLKFESELAVIKAQDEERNRISADMHDDLGAGMTSIRLYTELAKNKIKENVPELDKISKNANEVLEKMNAIIWSMNTGNDTFGNLVGYIRSYITEFFEDSSIRVKIEIPDFIPAIPVNGQMRRNVFLVVREALNNVMKHSKATEVSFKLIITGKKMQFTIHDNGIGIDFSEPSKFGNGLRNMMKRMVESDLEMTIENRNGVFIMLATKPSLFDALAQDIMSS